jgi:HPt (histidine-containing phosphotransfer) domain-containing protein
MDGIETFERIRALGTEYAQSVPIIALTANAVSGNAEMFRDKGFAAFLSKPLDFLELDAVIRQWVRDKEYEKSIEQESEDSVARGAAGETSVPHSAAAQGTPKAFVTEGVVEGVTGGVTEGVVPGTARGVIEGVEHGAARGVIEGVIARDAVAQGVVLVEGTAVGGAAGTLEPMALLEQAGINVNCGLERFGGCVEEYLRILALYLAETTTTLEKVRELSDPERQQLSGYAVVVHGIKGSSRSVGAEELAETAEQLEKAAKADDWGFVMAHTEAFLDQAQILLGRMKKALEVLMPEEEKPSKSGPDDALLVRLYEAAANFSIDDVEDALEELEDYEYQYEGELVVWLRQQYDRLAFDEIAVRLSDYASIRRGEIDEYQAAS